MVFGGGGGLNGMVFRTDGIPTDGSSIDPSVDSSNNTVYPSSSSNMVPPLCSSSSCSHSGHLQTEATMTQRSRLNARSCLRFHFYPYSLYRQSQRIAAPQCDHSQPKHETTHLPFAVTIPPWRFHRAEISLILV